jgi:hypothetical protein
MTIAESRKIAAKGKRTAGRALESAAESVQTTGHDFASTAADIGEATITGLRTGVEAASARLPGLIEAGTAGSADAFQSLRDMPDARLALLASFSIGLGAGLWLAGAPRLVTLAAFSPAIIVGLASMSESRSRTSPRRRGR